jgi:uncharacterized membrane protein YfbV (UPF0208 family)
MDFVAGTMALLDFISWSLEHKQKKQEAEQKFQEAKQQRRYQEIANLLAEMRAQNQQWSS